MVLKLVTALLIIVVIAIFIKFGFLPDAAPQERAALIFVDITPSISDQQFTWLLQNRLLQICNQFQDGDRVCVRAISAITMGDTPHVEIKLPSSNMMGELKKTIRDSVLAPTFKKLITLRNNPIYTQGTCIKESILIIQNFLRGLPKGKVKPEIYYLSDMETKCKTRQTYVDSLFWQNGFSRRDTLKIVVYIPFHHPKPLQQIVIDWKKPFFEKYFYVDDDSLFSVK
jgi:hypothetical protein